MTRIISTNKILFTCLLISLLINSTIIQHLRYRFNNLEAYVSDRKVLESNLEDIWLKQLDQFHIFSQHTHRYHDGKIMQDYSSLADAIYKVNPYVVIPSGLDIKKVEVIPDSSTVKSLD